MVQLVINATTAMAGEAGWTLASPATAVVEFMAKWLNLYPRTVPAISQMNPAKMRRANTTKATD